MADEIDARLLVSARLVVDPVRFGDPSDLFVASGQSDDSRIEILKIAREPFGRVTS